jgi:signal peptidase I
MRKRLTTVLKRTAGLVTGLAVLVAVGYLGLFLAGYRPVAVYSGSMEPDLAVGSLAFVKRVPAQEIEVGDVITFSDPYQPGRLVTHRVVEIGEQPEGGLAYRTKGDANLERDPWTIALGERGGRVAFAVPYGGYAVWYAKTREARAVLILVVAALVLLALLRAIWREDDRELPETASR